MEDYFIDTSNDFEVTDYFLYGYEQDLLQDNISVVVEAPDFDLFDFLF